jgi:hypothetical protein
MSSTQTIPRRRTVPGVLDPQRAQRRGLLVVVVGFVVSRLAYAAIGIRFDATALHPRGLADDQWQMLDTHLLTHHLVQSVWHLQSQPPLFNLFSGIVLHLPLGLQQPVAGGCFWLLGLVLACSTYLLLVELEVPWWAAVIASLVVVANPATILFENWLSWSYPAASLLTVGAYCCARFIKTRHPGWGVALFTCFALVVFDDSTFQWVWLVAVLVAILVFMKTAWRQLLLVSVVPLLLVGGWYARGAVMFGTATTSSWFGMNLASTSIARAPEAQLQELVREGRVNSIATTVAFEPVGAYDPKFVRTPVTGVRTLDARIKSDGATNYNNLAYVAVSSQYLRADLAYIKAEPGTYARNVALGVEVWFVPADQYPIASDNYAGDGARISGYANAYNAAILWQGHSSEYAGFQAATRGVAPSVGEYSYSTVIEYMLALLVAPFVVFRRRHDRALAGTLAVLWLTVGYSFLTTSLTSLGENMRFQFELGSLPLVLAVAVLTSLLKAAHRKRRPNGHEGSSGTDTSRIIASPALREAASLASD